MKTVSGMDSTESGKNQSKHDEPLTPNAPVAEAEMRSPHRRMKFILAALGVSLFFAALLVVGILPRVERQKKITNAALEIEAGAPIVNVITAGQAPADSKLELPGNIEAIQTATVSAQTSGYLRRWYVDIGDRVSAGLLLAEIDTPEVDQQLQQALATLTQSKAGLGQAEANLRQATTNMEFTRVSNERWKYLAKQHVVSDQDRDQTEAAYNAANATVDAMQANINAAKALIAASEANVQRLRSLQGFKKVFAPFAGIITARNVEIGSLITAGSGSGASVSTGSTPAGATGPGNGTTQTSTGASAASGGLFQIARIDTVRIFISVPQTFVSSIKPGQTTEISVREFPQNVITGRVVRTTNALDQSSRTLLTEIQTQNPNNQLLPGMYATVKFDVALAHPPVRIPATAMTIRAGGPQAVIVTGDQRAHFQKIVIGQDYGAQLDIVSGLEPGARLIVNIPDDLQDGEIVRARPAINIEAKNLPQTQRPPAPSPTKGGK
jgi:multidrug efflux pump subunit AcrA (membrane-fusion protein)